MLLMLKSIEIFTYIDMVIVAIHFTVCWIGNIIYNILPQDQEIGPRVLNN